MGFGEIGSGVSPPKRPKRPWQHLYNTARWDKLREWQLAMEPLCQFCKQQDVVTEADIVDHVIPHKGSVDLFFDPENLQSLCKHCHDSVKRRIELGQGVVTFGPDGWPL